MGGLGQVENAMDARGGLWLGWGSRSEDKISPLLKKRAALVEDIG
jgi:hypothetical protein